MAEWWLGFLSNMLAGLVSGALIGLLSARSKKDRNKPTQSTTGSETPGIEVDARSQHFETIVFMQAAPHRPSNAQSRDRSVSTSGDADNTWGIILGAALGGLVAAWTYLRYEDTVLLVATFLTAFIASFVVAALLAASQASVRFSPPIALELSAFCIAFGTVLVSIYFLASAANSPDRQALANKAAGSLADFASSASPQDWLAIIYQLLGLLVAFALLVLVSMSGIGLLALVRGARLREVGRRPRPILARLAAMRLRGWSFLVGSTVMSALSLALSSGLIFGWISQTQVMSF